MHNNLKVEVNAMQMKKKHNIGFINRPEQITRG